MIDARIHKGMLVTLYRGVYSMPGVSRTWESTLLASQLYLGLDAVVSHRAAARHWGLLDAERGVLEFTLRNRKRNPPRGVSVHCSNSLRDEDVRRLSLIQVTKVERT